MINANTAVNKFGVMYLSKSILQPMEPEQCYNCGSRVAPEVHHIYAGTANRSISDANGFWVYLCARCHRGKNGAQYSSLGYRLKRECQEEFEKTHTREEFMKLIGRNYVTDEEEEN